MKQDTTRSKCSLGVFALYAVLPLATALTACSGEAVVMGEDNAGSAPLPATSRCLASTALTGDLVVEAQEDLETLEGCQQIDGSLTISIQAADLRPLYALTSVSTTLSIRGNTPSLDGLESLRTVGNLTIEGLLAGDLAPLGHLEFMTIGTLTLTSCPNLVDLDGLAELKGVRHLWLGCSALETLAPLELPEQMADIWSFGSSLAQLTDLGVRELSGSLVISNSQLSNLDAFSALKSVGGIEVRENARLENMDATSGLGRAGRIVVIENPNITRLPDYPELQRLGELWITGNDRLAQWPEFPALYSWDLAAPPSPLIGRDPTIEIKDNPALTSVTLRAPWLEASAVIISGNEALTQFEITEPRLGSLTVVDNAVLASAIIHEMDWVGVLDVAHNPLLDDSIFAAVRSLERRVEDNADVP